MYAVSILFVLAMTQSLMCRKISGSVVVEALAIATGPASNTDGGGGGAEFFSIVSGVPLHRNLINNLTSARYYGISFEVMIKMQVIHVIFTK